MTYNTNGLILSYRDIGEHDRIYSILTEEHGKIEGWAQGVRKPQSKLVASLQPLYFCDFMFARGKRFDRIAQVKVLRRWGNVWSDLEKLSRAVYATSLIEHVVRPGTREKKVCELIFSMLTILSTDVRNPSQPPLTLRGGDGGITTLFTLHLLQETGFSPMIRSCVWCKKAVEGLTKPFDAMRGGILCKGCTALLQAETFPVSSITLDTLEMVLQSPLQVLEMPEAVRKELGKVADTMVQAHIGEEPRARRLIDYLQKEPLYIGQKG